MTDYRTRTENAFIRISKENCLGMENAMSAGKMALRLGISTRELRKLKRHIFLVHHLPIGSTTRGFFWAKNDHEMMKIHRAYESRIEKYSPMMKEAKNQIVNRTQEELL